MSVLQVASSMFKSVKSLPRKIFGTRNERLLKVYHRQVIPINEIEEEVRGNYDEVFSKRIVSEQLDDLTEEQRAARLAEIRYELSEDLRDRLRSLRDKLDPHWQPLYDWWDALEPGHKLEEYYKDEFRKRHARIITEIDEQQLLPEAFALLREASRRAQDHRHFDSQLIGGRVLFEGRIAEMKTGEGKTIVCHLAAFLKVISGQHVHIVTVNDYLVKRDAEFARRSSPCSTLRSDTSRLRWIRAVERASATRRTAATSTTGPTANSGSTTFATT